MSEAIYKLSPDRTTALRGFDGFGAAASITAASATGFTVQGVFRDFADFAVVVLWDSDNVFEHYSIRYLPDFDFTGMVLSFDYTTIGLQPLDSVKFSWIDWGLLDVITEQGQPLQVPFWPNATYKSGTFTAASQTFTISGTAAFDDSIALFIDNVGFGYTTAGGETAAFVAGTLRDSVNSYDWSTFGSSSVSVYAKLSGSTVTLTNAQTGTVNVSGTTVTWVSGEKFQALAAGDDFILVTSAGVSYIAGTIASITSPTALTLGSSAGTHTAIPYTAPRRGIDGNGVTAYILINASGFSVDKTSVPLTGGVSDSVTWTVSIDFSTTQGIWSVSIGGDGSLHSIAAMRQAWITFAPQIANGVAYADTEWSAVIANWSVTDPSTHRPLKVAGPGSVRIGNQDSWVTYSGSWTQLNAGNSPLSGSLYHGVAYSSNTPGDSITIKYSCQFTHDVYIGGELYSDRGIVAISLDGGASADMDMFLNASEPTIGRRTVPSLQGIAAGNHVITITITGTNHAALGTWDANSSGYYFLFDYLDAAVLSDVPDPAATYSNVTAALDYDTDATYKMPPQRVLWALKKLGFLAQVNFYAGVFWWNQRVRVGGMFNSSTLTFSGTWSPGDTVMVNVGGLIMGKSVTAIDDSSTIATHFADYINSAAVAVWASASGAVTTITQRTPAFTATIPAPTVSSSSGTAVSSGDIVAGTMGTWQIDDTASYPLNISAKSWHADFYAELVAQSLTCSTAISMELVNPPPSGYFARFLNGDAVATDTGFSSLISSHCAIGASKVIAIQKAALKAYADLQNAAGLAVYLQLGEFLWWYFCQSDTLLSQQSVPIGFLSFTTPISVGTAAAHNLNTGDRVIISGAQGMTAANGTWPIHVTDATHYTLDGSVPNAAWVSGTGLWSGGTMAFYDSETTADFFTANGRALFTFTCQDDDPTVNGGVDADFLAARLFAHTSSLISYIQGFYGSAKFELLFPHDVSVDPLYWNPAFPYPQGGRLNRAVDFPAQLAARSGSNFDRLKMEALSWGASYRNLDLAKQAIAFSGAGWPTANTAYLVPIFNGGCPFRLEYLAAVNAGIPLIVLWAFDHLGLLSAPLPLPVNAGTANAS